VARHPQDRKPPSEPRFQEHFVNAKRPAPCGLNRFPEAPHGSSPLPDVSFNPGGGGIDAKATGAGGGGP